MCGVYFTSAAMPHRLCSMCELQGRFLEHVSRDALVEYYRCDGCEHVWTHRKVNPNSPPEPVTVEGRDSGTSRRNRSRASTIRNTSGWGRCWDIVRCLLSRPLSYVGIYTSADPVAPAASSRRDSSIPGTSPRIGSRDGADPGNWRCGARRGVKTQPSAHRPSRLV